MRWTLLAAPCFALLSPTLGLAGSDGLVGTWLTDGGDSKIRIAPCGTSFCGHVAWAKSNGLDGQNPDPALRKRTIIGLPLTRDMHPGSDGGWEGSIYNPENGKTYAITMRTRGANKLEVEGCVLGVLCGSETWSRLEETASAASLPASRP